MSMTLSTASLNNWVLRTTNENQAVQFGMPKAASGLNGRRIGPAAPSGSNAAVEYLVVENRTGTSRAAQKAANEFARQQFLGYIFKECGVAPEEGLNALPENVKTAMKLNGGLIERHDWDAGKSRPLTARRIRAVMSAIVDFKAARKAQARRIESNVAMRGMVAAPEHTAKLIWDEFGGREFWEGLDKGLRDKLVKSTVVMPSKELKNEDLTKLRNAWSDGKHGKSLKKWLWDVNAAYRKNPTGTIQIDVTKGTVAFV